MRAAGSNRSDSRCESPPAITATHGGSILRCETGSSPRFDRAKTRESWTPRTNGSHPHSGTSRSTGGGDIRSRALGSPSNRLWRSFAPRDRWERPSLCPTLITAPADHLLHGVRTIAAACDSFADVDSRVLGIHLEGPFLSERDGYRGAHPAACIRDPDWSLFRQLQEAADGRIVMMTLAPERKGAIEFIGQATDAGVLIALGHTAADGGTIQAATEAGARLSTHLGNGIAAELPRHPNPIWQQAASPVLMASLIADGHHLDPATLRVLARAKGLANIILVSDASPLAGLPVGHYGDWAVDPSGKIIVAGTTYLAGSNQGLEVGLQNLLTATGCTLEQALNTVTSTPARLLGRPVHRLVPGEPADLVIFRCPNTESFVLSRVCLNGRWELG